MVIEKNVKTEEVMSQTEESKLCDEWRKTLDNAELYPWLWNKPVVNGKNVKNWTVLKIEILVEEFLPEVWCDSIIECSELGQWDYESSPTSLRVTLRVLHMEKTRTLWD